MVEISTSILTVEKGEESAVFFELEAAKTDYFHIDVMDGKFVEKNTYKKMLEYASYIKRISNLPLDVHLMVKDRSQTAPHRAPSPAAASLLPDWTWQDRISSHPRH